MKAFSIEVGKVGKSWKARAFPINIKTQRLHGLRETFHTKLHHELHQVLSVCGEARRTLIQEGFSDLEFVTRILFHCCASVPKSPQIQKCFVGNKFCHQSWGTRGTLVGVKDCAGVLHLQDFQSVRAALSGAQPFEFKPGCCAKKGVLGFVAHLIPNKVMRVHTSYVG